MVVIEKPVGDLIPYERNAKIHSEDQIDQLAESIRQFGFRNPILIDRNNVIMAGHGRLAAAKQAGLDTVPCICADDMTADEVRKYRLIDNKTAESPWDYSLLTVELEGLDFEGFDLDWGTDNAMPQFEDFDGDGDGGGSYITNGDKVRIVIGPREAWETYISDLCKMVQNLQYQNYTPLYKERWDIDETRYTTHEDTKRWYDQLRQYSQHVLVGAPSPFQHVACRMGQELATTLEQEEYWQKMMGRKSKYTAQEFKKALFDSGVLETEERHIDFKTGEIRIGPRHG